MEPRPFAIFGSQTKPKPRLRELLTQGPSDPADKTTGSPILRTRIESYRASERAPQIGGNVSGFLLLPADEPPTLEVRLTSRLLLAHFD